MQEIWKEVPSKPGIKASNFGRVLLPETTAMMPNGGIRSYKPKPTYGNKTKSNKNARHLYMGLYNRKFGNLKVHRLVCEAFHGQPPFGRAVVIHIDEDATNNNADNLRWGSQKENLNMPGFIAYCRSRTGENSPRAKWYKKNIDHEK